LNKSSTALEGTEELKNGGEGAEIAVAEREVNSDEEGQRESL
jgi:hypothetical protein